jgi:hypothetical protein
MLRFFAVADSYDDVSQSLISRRPFYKSPWASCASSLKLEAELHRARAPNSGINMLYSLAEKQPTRRLNEGALLCCE